MIGQRHLQRREDGIVLPVVLIILLVLTIVSLVLVDQISTQTRMAGNAALEQITLQAAEAGLRNVTSELHAGIIPSTPASYYADSNGMYFYQASKYSSTVLLPWKNEGTWSEIANNLTLCTNGAPMSPAITECKYMIEMLPAVAVHGGGQVYVYRITVRVVGPAGQGVVMLQTLYQIPIA